MGVGKNNHAAHILANTPELLFGIKKRAKHKRGSVSPPTLIYYIIMD
jgi:hypothetical protein